MKNNAQLVQPEIALRLDASGVIRKALFSSEIANEGLAKLVGQRWADTVSGTDGQVHRMMLDAREKGVSPIQRVRQRFPSGVEFSIEYTAMRLGADGGFIAIGRNLEVIAGMRLRVISTQAEMARDSWKLHNVATRHRLLQDASSEPLIIVDAESFVVEEVNPAARRALGVESDVDFLPKVAAGERESLRATLDRLREQGESPEVVMNLSVDGRSWHTRASLVKAERGAMFVLRLSAAASIADDAPDASPMARLRDAVVVVDPSGAIVRANPAFVELVQKDDEASLIGAELDHWLARSATISGLVPDSVRKLPHGELTAVVRGDRGGEWTVEIHAVQTPDVVCMVLPRVSAAPESPVDEGEVDVLTMRKRIEDGVSLVERRCFLTAVELAKRDRHAVAQLLGIDASIPPSAVREGP